jgi:hypothetical protein
MVIGQTVLVAAACANVLGIDHDYRDRPKDRSNPPAEGGQETAAGAPGTSTGGKSSTGGTKADAGEGPETGDGGSAGEGGALSGGSASGGARIDAGSGAGGAGTGRGVTGGSSAGGTGGRSELGGAGHDATGGRDGTAGGTGGRANTGGSGPGGSGRGGTGTGGAGRGGSSLGGTGTGGASRGGSSPGGTGTGGASRGGSSTGGTGTGGAVTGGFGGTGGTSTPSGGSSSGGSAGAAGSGGGAPKTTKVQSGSTTIESGSATVQATIEAIDPSKAFLVFGTRFDSTSPGLTCVSGQITSDSQLTFTHATDAGAPAIPILYYVAEFPSGVAVQRGSQVMTSTSVTVSLPASAALATSFPIVTFRNTGSNYSMNDFVRAKLTSSSELTLSVAEASADGIVEWQVVSFDGASVQSGDLDITSGTAVFPVTLAQDVDPARTWLLLSYQVSALGNASELMMRGRVSSTTGLTFERTGTAPAPGGQLTYYAVSFDDSTSVQSGTAELSSVATGAVALTPAVHPAAAIATLGGIYQRGGATSFTSDANAGHATFTLDLGTGAELSVARGASSSDASADYYVIEFP